MESTTMTTTTTHKSATIGRELRSQSQRECVQFSLSMVADQRNSLLYNAQTIAVASRYTFVATLKVNGIHGEIKCVVVYLFAFGVAFVFFLFFAHKQYA